MPMTMFGQSYKNMWKLVEDAEEKVTDQASAASTITELEAEIAELRVPSEIEGIQYGDERQGAGARGEPELVVANGADGDAGVGIA